jgi:AbrB family looped-hinge helix DNA binding protein
MQAQSVTVNSQYRIALPRAARERLNIKQGDRLVVDVQDGLLILIPEPLSYAERLLGLHSHIWNSLGTEGTIDRERNAWDESHRD